MKVLQQIKLRLFHVWLDNKASRIRKKDTIRFGFLIQELTQWKSESLYQAMLAHPRFEPVLCISPSLGYPGAESALIGYCQEKGYDYFLLDPEKTIVAANPVRGDPILYEHHCGGMGR